MAKKGTLYNDRELAAEVRRLTLTKVKLILRDDYEDKEFQKRILERLVTASLPRINEHSGPEGGAIEIKGVEIVVRK